MVTKEKHAQSFTNFSANPKLFFIFNAFHITWYVYAHKEYKKHRLKENNNCKFCISILSERSKGEDSFVTWL